MMMMMIQSEFSMTAALVRKILEQPHGHNWSLQGFGQLRLYLDGVSRLHVWCPSLAVHGIEDSSVHDHPWDFESTLISGSITDIMYDLAPVDHGWDQVEVYNEQLIKCGPGGFAKGDLRRVGLRRVMEVKYFNLGVTYRHRAEDIHRSMPSEGAVTLIKRTFRSDRCPDTARVYWRGERWVSAEPRPATTAEITVACAAVLKGWQ